MGDAVKVRLSWALYGLCGGFVLGVTGKSLLYLIAAAAFTGVAIWAWQKFRSRNQEPAKP